jgi:hypothetical protein
MEVVMPMGVGFWLGCGLAVLGEIRWRARIASPGKELRSKDLGIRNGIPRK